MSQQSRKQTSRATIKQKDTNKKHQYEQRDKQKNIAQIHEKTILQRKYKFPSMMQEAELHKKANMFGIKSPIIQGGKDTPVCPCCNNLVSTIQIQLCYKTTPSPPKMSEEIFILPPSVSMYFTFVKMAIIFILLRILLFDSMTMLFAIGGHYCIDNPIKCNVVFGKFSGYNLLNKRDIHWIQTLQVLNLLFTLCAIVFFVVYRKYQHKINNLINFSYVGQEEFSIFMYDIPWHQFVNVNDVVQNFKQQLNNKLASWIASLPDKKANNIKLKEYEQNMLKMLQNPYHLSKIKKKEKIVDIVLCHDISQITNINEIHTKLLQQLDQSIYKQGDKSNPQTIFQISKDNFHNLYRKASQKFDSYNQKQKQFFLTHFTGKMFVTCQYQHFKAYLVDQKKIQFNVKLKNKMSNNKNYVLPVQVPIIEAVSPTDVLWQNMKVTKTQRYKSVFYSYIVLFMTLVFGLGGLIGLQITQSNLSKKVDPVKGGINMVLSYSLTISMAVLTTIINYILAYAIDKLTNFQRHETKSNRLASLIVKTALAQFINTSIIYLLLWKISSKFQIFTDMKDPLGKDGIYSKLFGLVTVSSCITLGLQIAMPGYYIGRIINWWKYRNLQQINQYQIKLNKSLQYPQFDFAAQYSSYLVLVYIISFFAVLIPVASYITLCVFIVKYWIDKYNLFRRSSHPIQFGFKLSRLILKCFECSLLVFSIGFIIWIEELNYQALPIGLSLRIINFFIALFYVAIAVFSPSSVEEYFFKTDSLYEQDLYTNLVESHMIKKTYRKQNPGTAFLIENNKKNPTIAHLDKIDEYIELKKDNIYIPRYDARITEWYDKHDTSCI